MLFQTIRGCIAFFFAVAISNVTIAQTIVTTPLLDKDVILPNGGTIKLFSNKNLKDDNRSNYIKIFEESPYQLTTPLLYNRYGWWRLEKGENEYTFDEVVEPLLLEAVSQKARVIIGLASMCAESSGMSHIYKEKVIAIPNYLFDSLNQSVFPMLEDNQYTKGKKGFSVNYDSPLVYERFSRLLRAFRKWLHGRIKGTNLRRSDVVYAIEMRHLGYWGEGAVLGKYRPKTSLIEKYIDLYLKEFPRKLLIGGILSTVHLPKYKGDDLKNYSQEDIVMMRYNYKLMTLSNKAGRIGGFIDSWMPNSDLYDSVSKRVLLDDEWRIVYLSDFLTQNYWGKVYLTGEFGYLINESNKQYAPYNFIGDQFRERNVSGISIHNLTAKYLSDGKPYQLKKEEYDNVLRALSTIGYRIVLTFSKIEKRGRKYEATVKLKNIGTSGIFHDYYEMHFITKNDSGIIISDMKVPFDFRCIKGAKDQVPGNSADEIIVQCRIPKKSGKLYLLIKDKYGIEYPMTLSNKRRMPDGSYFLGAIN